LGLRCLFGTLTSLAAGSDQAMIAEGTGDRRRSWGRGCRHAVCRPRQHTQLETPAAPTSPGDGKAAPLRRRRCGDRVFTYSPKRSLGGNDSLQAFTTIGHLRDHQPYQVEMAPGFNPWRRDVNWLPALQALIRPMLNALSFTRSKSNWGYQFRFGLFEIIDADADLIAMAMGLPALWSSINCGTSASAAQCCDKVSGLTQVVEQFAFRALLVYRIRQPQNIGGMP